jgi:hypothetical protein
MGSTNQGKSILAIIAYDTTLKMTETVFAIIYSTVNTFYSLNNSYKNFAAAKYVAAA